MKGILLAAGKGTRLAPMTLSVSKILLPVYDKPMAYYPLTTLIEIGVDDVLVITSESDRGVFEELLGDGSRFGIRITYAVQKVQRGIADAFIIAEDWIAGEPCVLILGDNIYVGRIPEFDASAPGATVFAIHVPDPNRFGVVELGPDGEAVSLVEKPPKGTERSDLAVVGLYVYDGTASERSKRLEPSARGELEVTDLNRSYLEDGELSVRVMPEDMIWEDAGTFDSLLTSGNLVADIQHSTGRLIGSPEAAALSRGLLSPEDLLRRIATYKPNPYWDALREMCDRRIADKPRDSLRAFRPENLVEFFFIDFSKNQNDSSIARHGKVL